MTFSDACEQFALLEGQERTEMIDLALRLATDRSGAFFDERRGLARLVCMLGADLEAMQQLAAFDSLGTACGIACPSEYCAGSEKQPLVRVQRNPSLFRCATCGLDWSLAELLAYSLRHDMTTTKGVVNQ
jgi:hypothetical protein